MTNREQVARIAGVLVALAIGWQLPLEAQRARTVRGAVRDAVSGAAVAQAVVSVVGGELKATTDEQGRYQIDGVVADSVQVNAQQVGFHPITTPVYYFGPDRVVVVDFRLAPLPVALPPLEVRGERREHRTAIGAKVLTPKDLPGRGNILSALQGVVPGLQTSGRRDDVGVRLRQSHASALFVIDGTVITPPLMFYIDTQDVACVEVRRGYRAAQEFRPSINSQPYSGVILIWTRGSQAPLPRECAAPQR